MSDKMRWRYGDTNPVIAAVDSETVIEIGDLLWQDVSNAKPAAAFANKVPFTLPVCQEGFTKEFLGVAMQRSRAGEQLPIRVATTGVFEFDCSAGTFELGDLVGIDGALEDANTTLLNQQITKVTNVKSAIGRIARRESLNAVSVLVDIRSTVMTGGVFAREV